MIYISDMVTGNNGAEIHYNAWLGFIYMYHKDSLAKGYGKHYLS